MRSLFALFLVSQAGGISGCQQRVRPDWEIYTEVIGRSPPETTDLERCALLRDRDLRGDCSMMVALGAARAQDLPAAALCGRVSDGVWRDECHFIAAESMRSQGKTAEATETCREAGRFASDCAMHLWQRAVATLVKRYGPTEIAELEPRAQRMYDRWNARVGDFSDFRVRFWIKLFRQLWSQGGPVDAHLCSGLARDLQHKCVVGAAIVLDQALRVSLDQPRWAAAFCEGPSPSSGALASLPDPFPELARFSAHPGLDELVMTFHTAFCLEERLPPHPDPPRRGPALSERPAAPPP